MQHVHVKRKENPMNRYIKEEYYRIPDLRSRLDLAARRERARFIGAGFTWLLNYAKAHLTPRIPARTPRWIERLG
jgi:hypothetical protein